MTEKSMRLAGDFDLSLQKFCERAEIEGGALLSLTLPPSGDRSAAENLFGDVRDAMGIASIQHVFMGAARQQGAEGVMKIGFDSRDVGQQAQGVVKFILNDRKLGYVLGLTEYLGGEILNDRGDKKFLVSDSMTLSLR